MDMSGGYKNNFMDDNDLKIIQGVKNYMGESPVIIDVGANRGNYTDFALTLFPNAKVVLIEPNDMWIDELKRKYSDNKNIDIFNTTDGTGKSLFGYNAREILKGQKTLQEKLQLPQLRNVFHNANFN